MRIFISSTYQDLSEHRSKVAETLERLGLNGVRMEVFGARPSEASTCCYDEIDSCDAFIGIYAHRYGYIPDNCEASITEQEFDYAREKQIPMFCFVVDDDHLWLPAKIEGEPGQSYLNRFKENKIRKCFVVDSFTTPDDLALKVATSLARFIIKEKKKKKDTIHYDWILSYSNSMAEDWLARQTEESRETISEYLRSSSIKRGILYDSKVLNLVAEYHGYQLASGRVYQGVLVCDFTETEINGIACLTFDPNDEPVLVQINGNVQGKGRLELCFRQQPRTVHLGNGMFGRIKAFNYMIVLHKNPSNPFVFKGSLYHPDYDDFEIAKTTLVPRLDE